MGSIFGGRLRQNDQDVLLYDVAASAVKKINESGLRIIDKNGDTETIAVQASTDPADTKNSDAVIIFTKCFHTESAIQSLRPFFKSTTKIISLQNGWGNAQTISNIIGKENLLLGVNYVSGTLLEPGFVKQVGNPVAYIGRWAEPADDFTHNFSTVLSGTGVQTKACDDVITEIWKKLALNVATLPTATLLGFQAHLLVAYEPVLDLMKKLLHETICVAQALHIGIEYEERLNSMTNLLKNAVGAKGSMLQDAEASRRTEIDVINGAIVQSGKELGIETPYNESMVMLIKAMEQNYLP